MILYNPAPASTTNIFCICPDLLSCLLLLVCVPTASAEGGQIRIKSKSVSLREFGTDECDSLTAVQQL